MSNEGGAGQGRIALLIDAENVSMACVDRAIKELSPLGQILVRRAYGNWAAPDLQGWKDKILELSIRPIQQFNYAKGKNAADIALVIDAMELLLTGKVDAFCIVSSDSDFTPLVMKLREHGCDVFGVGKPEALTPYSAVFTAFFKVAGIKAGSGSAAAKPKAAVKAKPAPAPAKAPTAAKTAKPSLKPETVSRLLQAIAENAQPNGWAELGVTCSYARKTLAVQPSAYGRKHVKALFNASERFKVVTPGDGSSYVSDVLNKDRAAKPL